MHYEPLDLEVAAGQGYLPTEQPLKWALQFPNYPVATSEIGNFISWYPVVFVRTEDKVDMVVPAASSPGSSVLVNDRTGLWIGRQLPFFLRRFPFLLDYPSSTAGAKGIKLLVADVPEAQLSSDAPRIVVDAAGGLTDFGKSMIKRMAQYDRVRELDRQRLSLIDKLELLVPHQIDFGDHEEDTTSDPHMFWKIDERAVLELPAAAASEIHALKAWRLIYGHLFSLRHSDKPKAFRLQMLNRQSASVDAGRSVFEIPEGSDDLIEF
jgi:hypothetical protein